MSIIWYWPLGNNNLHIPDVLLGGHIDDWEEKEKQFYTAY